jgi:sodium-independent sulfate anion transporter 11
MVLLALYALTSMFFYIPMSSLAGLIIHAVGDLISPPNVVYQFWELSPIEVVIFFGGVFLTIFTSIENGIYFTIAASVALLLFRIARAKGAFLGRVRVYRIKKDEPKEDALLHDRPVREAYVPFDHRDGSNPNIEVSSPSPGIFIYRFTEGFNFTNQAYYLDQLVEYIKKETRRTLLDNFQKIGVSKPPPPLLFSPFVSTIELDQRLTGFQDRPWNDPGPRRGQKLNPEDHRPILRAIILDLSSVNHLDVTSVQGLIDVRNQLDNHASPNGVEWHFATVNNPWTRRALAVAGFGYPSALHPENIGRWKPIFSVAAKSDASTESEPSEAGSSPKRAGKEEEGLAVSTLPLSPSTTSDVAKIQGEGGKFAAIQGMNRPYFHLDVGAALESAVANIPEKN